MAHPELEHAGMTVAEFAAWLAQMPFEAVRREALERSAAVMAEAVRQTLSEAPEGGEHDLPWLRSGALRDSIGHESDDSEAVIGSADSVAVFQEAGTDRVPPRPFLAPVAERDGEAAARSIGAAIAEMFR